MCALTRAIIGVVLITGFLCSGCGLLINGREQKVLIDSAPQGARIVIPSAGIEAVTPASVSLPRNEDHAVFVKMKGFSPAKAYITSKLEPVSLILDIVIFFPALVVDIPMGGTYKLEPDNLYINLEGGKKPAMPMKQKKRRPPKR